MNSVLVAAAAVLGIVLLTRKEAPLPQLVAPTNPTFPVYSAQQQPQQPDLFSQILATVRGVTDAVKTVVGTQRDSVTNPTRSDINYI